MATHVVETVRERGRLPSVPILLAGVAALLFGGADYLGGVASTMWPARRVGAVVQGVGVPVTVAALLVGGPPEPATADLAWGGVAGLASVGGIAALYRSLAIGPMNVAAPTTAVVGSVVPIAFGLALGERPGPWALVGVGCGIAAVAMVGSSPAGAGDAPTGRRNVLVVAGMAGALIGIAVIAFSRTSAESGLWPLVVAKIVATTILWALARGAVGPKGDSPRALRMSLAAGALDSVAITCAVLALQRGLLVLVSVVIALYPVGTIVLARALLGETISRVQGVGLALAAAAVTLIAVS
jgi:drug/metabolite transporter (DMT)-like permease